jgi:hypothetical protein
MKERPVGLENQPSGVEARIAMARPEAKCCFLKRSAPATQAKSIDLRVGHYLKSINTPWIPKYVAANVHSN